LRSRFSVRWRPARPYRKNSVVLALARSVFSKSKGRMGFIPGVRICGVM